MDLSTVISTCLSLIYGQINQADQLSFLPKQPAKINNIMVLFYNHHLKKTPKKKAPLCCPLYNLKNAFF